MAEIKLTFNTITPLWTGDAWQKNSEVRPSSLMGSLRFWFEVICYFSGVCKKFNRDLGRFEKEVNRKEFSECLLKKGNTFETKLKCLLEQNIPLPSIIFGTTNWKGLIRIKELKLIEDYCFGNKLNLPYAIGYKKNREFEYDIFNSKEEWNNKVTTYNGRDFKQKLRNAKKEYSFFFFSDPYFYGTFEVVFEVEEEIIMPIFYPLLTFMEKYGFWGGKWNIGYGRLKVLSLKEKNNAKDDWRRNKFIFQKLENSNLVKIEKKFSEFIETVTQFNELLNNDSDDMKIKILENQTSNDNLKKLIKELIQIKAQERANFKANTEIRHKIFGKTGSSKKLFYVPQGSKILPYIIYEDINKTNNQDQNNKVSGFLSLVKLLNLEGEKDG